MTLQRARGRRAGHHATARAASARSVVLASCLLCGSLGACDEQAQVKEAPPAASVVRERLVSRELELGRAIPDSATAFELIPTLEGAKLLWAAKDAHGSIRAQALGADGKAHGAPRELYAGDAARGRVTDLVAVQLDAGAAVAWVEHVGQEARASVVISDGRAVPEAVDLGAAWSTDTEVRGNIALAGAREYALVFVRGTSEPCSEGDRDCFAFRLTRLDATPAAGAEAGSARGVPLSVPVPCSQHSTLLAVIEGRWHYGVCTLHDDAPVATVFNIQFDPEYAAAAQVLEGCRPLGLFEHQGQAWLSGDCKGTRRVQSTSGTHPVTRSLAGLELACPEGRMELRSSEFTLALTRPRANLEALLGPPWAPASARAIWTGRALLVARATPAKTGESELSLTRYSCE